MADLTGRAPQNLFGFTFVDGKYYESISRYQRINNKLVNVGEKKVPDDWNTSQSGPWYHIIPPANNDRLQGFKIHLSAIPENATKILEIGSELCLQQNLQFKFLCDYRILCYSLSKAYSRGGSGKFITIYPRDLKQFKSLLEILYEQTKDLDGPYILSDHSYKDSNIVFYRYGGFKKINKIDIRGQQEACIEDPDGNLISDVRTPYYKLPSWVEDPFGEKEISKGISKEDETILNNRFKIEEVIQYSNIGGVYQAIDLKEGHKEVIIKEARSNTGYLGDGGKFFGASSIARKEYDVLKELNDLEFVPNALSFFKEWKHSYIAMEKVMGTSLRSFRAKSEFNPFLKPGYTKDKEISRFCREVLDLFDKIIISLHKIHQRNIVFGDFAPQNILFDKELDRIFIIDFESAFFEEGEKN